MTETPAKARRGAGKVAAKAGPSAAPVPAATTAHEFLRNVMNALHLPIETRMRAALAVDAKEKLAGQPEKPEEKGKKQVQQEKANEIAGSGGVFQPRSPPKLVRA